MPRAIWSGAISFGLVNVPVKLYSAVSRKTVRFHQLDGKDNIRIAQKRVNPKTGEEVPYERLVKGYELGGDRYVVIDPDELEALNPKKTRTIDIEDFVDLSEIDPIFFDHPYYLAPAQGGEKAYALLRDAMAEAEKVAIARVVIRQKENLVAIRATGDVLTMATMLFADEVVPPETLDDAPDEEIHATERELKMARQLIDSLVASFEPDKYHDEYRAQVLDMIERKAQGKEIAVQPDAEEPAKVPDLMAALEASIEVAKGTAGKAADGNGGAAKKAPARKKASPASGKAKSASGKRSKSKTKS